MKKINRKFNIDKLPFYATLLSIVAISIFSFYAYSFLNTNIIATINSSEVSLDPSAIRAPDINMSRFEGIVESLEKKIISRQKPYIKNIFN